MEDNKQIKLPEITVVGRKATELDKQKYQNILKLALEFRDKGNDKSAEELLLVYNDLGYNKAVQWIHKRVQDINDERKLNKVINSMHAGTGKTARVLAPLVAAPIAVPLAKQIGKKLIKAIPTVVDDFAHIGKPFYKQLAKDTAAGLLGASAANTGVLALTGKTLDEHMSEGLQGVGLLGGTGNKLFNKAANSINKLENKLYSNKYLKKWDTSRYEQAINDLESNYTYQRNARNKLEQAVEAEMDEADKLLNFLQREIFPILQRYTNKPVTPSPSINRYGRNNSRFSFVTDFNKFFKYNSKTPQYMEKYGIVKKNDKYYFPISRRSYNLKNGKFQISKFGTDKTFTFEIKPAVDLAPASNYLYSNRTFVKPSSLLAEVPLEYVEILLHNMNYIKNLFPDNNVGFFGSSTAVTKGGLPHATGDFDLYITDKALHNYESKHGELPWLTLGKTKTLSLENGKYGSSGDIDLNIIKTKPDGTLDFTSQRSLNLFRQLYPDEALAAYIASHGDLSKMYHPKLGEDLVNEVSVLNSIMDAFESGKPKHTPKALWYLNQGDPDLVYKALLKHGESFLGTKMVHAPVNESMFLDATKNLKLLQDMNIQGLGNLESIAKDPKRMKLVFEYWWQNNTILSRGTSIENMPIRVADELGIPHERNFDKYWRRNMTKWSGGVGENWSGTGLNTVFFGDSGGGVRGNDIYGNMQPVLYGFTEGLSPSELIQVVRNNYPTADKLLPKPLNFKGINLTSYGDILGLNNDITPIELEQLTAPLNIRGIVGNPYNRSVYVGITSPINKPGDIIFINPSTGEYPHSTHYSQRNYQGESTLDFLDDIARIDKHIKAYEEKVSPHNEKKLPSTVYSKMEKYANELELGIKARSTLLLDLDEASVKDRNIFFNRREKLLALQDKMLKSKENITNKFNKLIGFGTLLPLYWLIKNKNNNDK